MRKYETKLLPVDLLSTTVQVEDTPSNILAVGSETKWNRGFTGKGVVIAVLDTGIDTNHPDLKERIIGGYNFTNDHGGDIRIIEDMNGHGTHVAGTIAGSMNGKGIVGVAPDAKLLILKVLDHKGSGSIRSLIDAINYAVDWRGPDGEKVRIISLSLGTKFPNADLYDVVKRAVNHNISVVVASGNDGDGNIDTNEYRYPGAYEEVIEVGAINEINEIANFSNTNETVDLYAPGVDINSSFLDQGYAVLSGTSMAAPHVTGAIALLIEEYESMLGREVNEMEAYELLMKHTTRVEVISNKNIQILNLKNKQQSIREVGVNMEIKNRDMLLKCYCEARKTQAFFTKCLDENSSEEEREFILELVKESAKTSRKIREFCEISVETE